ncbi:hydroxylysine kinase-like isoform X1 [Ostrea edulis]|uniref:hydroxylysine kinase-like isoform X1 n=1 Tax=Ostrea edulis TaxID=37623 RepID=UPI0024AF1D26|nr:hydroxylysine kinase-like isoform X1 [Ostrea edulis]
METRRPELPTLEIQGILNEECGWKVYQMDRLDSFQDSNYFVSYGISVGSHLKGDLQAMVRVIHRHLFKESEAETERKVMEQLHRDGFICTTCKPYSNKSWFYTTGDDQCVIRLFSFIPGIPLRKCVHVIDSVCMLKELGNFVGQLHNSLANISKDIVIPPRANDPWVLQNVSCLRTLLTNIKNFSEEKVSTILDIIDKFEKQVMTSFYELRKGVIHNDIHDLNIIVNYKDGKLHPIYPSCCGEVNYAVKAKYGLIDFNDIVLSPYLFEVAMAIRDLMTDVKDIGFLEIGGHFLAGYQGICPISEPELRLLPYCIQAALCQYIVVGESEFQEQPNNEYTRLGADDAWTVLRKLQYITNEEMLGTWKRLLM